MNTHHPTSPLDACTPSGTLTVAAAQAAMRQLAVPINGIEHVDIRAALERVLAADIISPLNVPAYDNSAMDGYAFAGDKLSAGAQCQLRVSGTAMAGVPFDGTVGADACVRIMTGALMPAGCDTVIPQEQVECIEQGGVTAIRFSGAAVRLGQHCRRAGEDLAQGKPALHAGKWLRPADLGLVASLGIAEVPVMRRLRVAFFSTGSELRSIGETLDAGCVYDSNRYTVFGMLRRLGIDVIDLGAVKDDEAALEHALRQGCENADAVITSGGVSVGEADFTKTMMARLGEVAFWQIAMRPGRPLAFGRITSAGRSALLFGLPGNPVAVMATFYHLVRDTLLAMMGAAVAPLPLLQVRSAQPLRKRAGRTEYLRGILRHAHDGQPEVVLTGDQGAGILRSMSEANCFVVLHHDQADVRAGEPVSIILLEGLI